MFFGLFWSWFDMCIPCNLCSADPFFQCWSIHPPTRVAALVCAHVVLIQPPALAAAMKEQASPGSCRDRLRLDSGSNVGSNSAVMDCILPVRREDREASCLISLTAT